MLVLPPCCFSPGKNILVEKKKKFLKKIIPWQVHRVVRRNNLCARTNIDPTWNSELLSTIIAKYKTKQ